MKFKHISRKLLYSLNTQKMANETPAPHQQSNYTTEEIQQLKYERDFYKEKTERMQKSLKEGLDIIDGLFDTTLECKTTVYDFAGNSRTVKVCKSLRTLAYERAFEDMSKKISWNDDFPKLNIKYDNKYKLLNEIVYHKTD